MKRSLILFIIPAALLALSSSFLPTQAHETENSGIMPTPETSQLVLDDLEQAFRSALEKTSVSQAGITLFEVDLQQIERSSDNQWGSAWLILKNPQTKEILPSEPGLGLAQKVKGTWKVILPEDPGWRSALLDTPGDLIPAHVKTTWLQMTLEMQASPNIGPLGGYRLPWAAGETVWLSQSTAHDRYITTGNAHFAYDFYIPKTMFNIHAAKAGTVWLYKDDVPNDDHSNVNFIVLRDASTSPVTYQLYLHLAQSSIPPQLKSVGAPVVQGQFIGVADNTGQSTGHHLHFQVEEEPYWLYWGVSLDVTFDEVAINGGRPRVSVDLDYCDRPEDVCDETSSSYISANTLSGDHSLPVGDILNPLRSTMVSTSTLRLEGWGSDVESGLASAQFIARYNGNWHEIGQVFTTTLFSTNWDLCRDHVPDGPVELALRLRDKSGNFNFNLPGLTQVTKKFTCPDPSPQCIPTADQVALFADPNLSGVCSLVDVGEYSGTAAFFALGEVGDDNLESIMVGDNVFATLYINSNLTGRGETFRGTDRNLSDDWIGANTVSSLIVEPKGVPASVPIPKWPPTNPELTSLSLIWENAGASTQYQARIFEGASQLTSTAWIDEPVWHLGSLNPGSYSWQVRSRNESNQSAWSVSRSLDVPPDAPPGATRTAPFFDNMEGEDKGGWSHSPNWDRTDIQNATPNGKISWMYDTNSELEPGTYQTGEPNSGYLTSPPIAIPDNGEYYLRFKYLFETEGPGKYWDQRWVQISVDGGQFANLLQLSDDQPNLWLNSQVIPLVAYAGQIVQVRFLFETLDENFNSYKGWFIDDFSISASPPPDCDDPKEPNNSVGEASAISINGSLISQICPGGDIDYYHFQGEQGDQIGITIDASTSGSKLDSYMTLLDIDGVSIVEENDDQLLFQRTDSHISLPLPYSGTFYIKVKAWNHPSAGGPDHFYSLKIVNEFVDPDAQFVYPIPDSYVPHLPITLEVNANDDPQGTGMSHVEFLWHSGDWHSGEWEPIGEDWDGTDGWTMGFDLSNKPDQENMAFYARAYDWAGNWTAAAVYELNKITQNTYLPLLNSRASP